MPRCSPRLRCSRVTLILCLATGIVLIQLAFLASLSSDPSALLSLFFPAAPASSPAPRIVDMRGREEHVADTAPRELVLELDGSSDPKDSLVVQDPHRDLQLGDPALDTELESVKDDEEQEDVMEDPEAPKGPGVKAGVGRPGDNTQSLSPPSRQEHEAAAEAETVQSLADRVKGPRKTKDRGIKDETEEEEVEEKGLKDSDNAESSLAPTKSAKSGESAKSAKASDSKRKTSSPESGPGPIAPVPQGKEKPKYLLPHLIYGPNNQYHGLREAVILARALGRTLVLPRIVVHYQQFKKGARRWHEFDEVFDVDALGQFVPVISLADFRALTGTGKISALWRPRVEPLYTDFEKRFTEVQEVTVRRIFPLHEVHPSNKKKEVFFASLQDVQETLGQHQDRFVAISCLYGTLVDFSGHPTRNRFLEETVEVARHLFFSSFYQTASKELRIFGGGKYLSLHVRTDEREAECLDTAAQKGAVCFGLGRPYYHLDVACLREFLVSTVKEHGLAGVYISPGERRDSLLASLRSGLRFPLLTSTDMAPEMAKLYQRHYHHHQDHDHPPEGSETVPLFVVSTLEQQIAIDSALFLGTRQSTWSQYVHYKREAHGLAMHDQYLNTIGCTSKYSVKYFKTAAKLKEGLKVNPKRT